MRPMLGLVVMKPIQVTALINFCKKSFWSSMTFRELSVSAITFRNLAILLGAKREKPVRNGKGAVVEDFHELLALRPF